MTENDMMAELSYAYLHAVAARAGFGCKVGNRIDDNAGVDAFVRVQERMSPESALWNFDFEVQLKATKQQVRAANGRYPYFFKGIDRYNTLREPGSPLPKLLVVLFLPAKPEQWLKLDEKALIAKRCAYWVSLKGAPESENDSGQTVRIPKSQILSVAGLREIAMRFSREEDLRYES
jgi:hypothetical protein